MTNNETTSPAASLVMTVYNGERYLAEAVESVLAQTRRNFELVVWDDGSTDRTLEIARDYAKLDDRVRVVAAKHLGRTRRSRPRLRRRPRRTSAGSTATTSSPRRRWKRPPRFSTGNPL